MSARFDWLRMKVIAVCDEWGLFQQATAASQYLKLAEELGELCDAVRDLSLFENAITNGGTEEIARRLDGLEKQLIDAIGDNAWMLIVICQLCDRNVWLSEQATPCIHHDGGLGDLASGYGRISRAIQKRDHGLVRAVAMECLSILGEIAEARTGKTLEDCLEAVHEIVSKRKGKMVDGVFVKECD